MYSYSDFSVRWRMLYRMECFKSTGEGSTTVCTICCFFARNLSISISIWLNFLVFTSSSGFLIAGAIDCGVEPGVYDCIL